MYSVLTRGRRRALYGLNIQIHHRIRAAPWRPFHIAANNTVTGVFPCRPSPRVCWRAFIVRHIQRRSFFEGMVTFLYAHVPTVLFPPALFVVLALTLWFQKCIMMIVFQNKIIYMPSLPPFSRQEKIEDYKSGCGPVLWQADNIRSLDGTRLAVCVGRTPQKDPMNGNVRKTVVLYFQGWVISYERAAHTGTDVFL